MNSSRRRKVKKSVASDPIGHHPGVQFQEEGLQFAQPALLLLLPLLASPALLVHTVVLVLLGLVLLTHPGHPGPAVVAGVGPGVVGREVNLHGRPVVVGQSLQQLADHIWTLLCQVPPLAGVGRDVEQPDVFGGGRFVVRRRDEGAFQVPPGAGQSGQNLQITVTKMFTIFTTFKLFILQKCEGCTHFGEIQ